MENRSAVARILQQIDAEFEAGQAALHAPAQTGAHAFITKRMEMIAGLHLELKALVGDEAIALIATRLDHLPRQEGKQ